MTNINATGLDSGEGPCGWCGKPLPSVKMGNSHGICPDCIREYFPEYADEVLAQEDKEGTP